MTALERTLQSILDEVDGKADASMEPGDERYHSNDYGRIQMAAEEAMVEAKRLNACISDTQNQSDMVPRSRYDACNADWLGEVARRKKAEATLAQAMTLIPHTVPAEKLSEAAGLVNAWLAEDKRLREYAEGLEAAAREVVAQQGTRYSEAVQNLRAVLAQKALERPEIGDDSRPDCRRCMNDITKCDNAVTGIGDAYRCAARFQQEVNRIGDEKRMLANLATAMRNCLRPTKPGDFTHNLDAHHYKHIIREWLTEIESSHHAYPSSEVKP